ncbi:hypothetical protein N7530_005330 [Penicillium desertorum]|uniref:Enoyl reductase (ER) domain-containing protein n=1 Tax=Penicillium desertorum TaxID=1303715 RepID=A0A9W9X109_9EURO|nr:hypothetical protein N7530_005330 [Penicillium desertorum]
MATKPTNISLYVDENFEYRVRRDIGAPKPGNGELLIETLFSGANPADVKHAKYLGIYPACLGYDFCGKVLQAPSCSAFEGGEIVAGYTPTGLGRPLKYGTHQTYMICPDRMAFLVPANLPPEHAACLSVVAMTAADALYNLFKFRLPQDISDNSGNPKATGPLLIWGASSSVGICALQFARASGVFPILVTTSPQRHSLLLKYGATHCFDYKSPTVRSDIEATLESYHCNGLYYGFDAVGGSAQQVASCASQDAILASVVHEQDPRFLMPFAVTADDIALKLPDVPHPITVPARPDDHWRSWSVLQWAVQNYRTHFQLELVDVFTGKAEDALEELERLGSHGRGFGKLVLKHPLQ